VRPRGLELARSGRSDHGGSEWLAFSGRVALAERLGRSVEMSVDVGDTRVIVVAVGERAAAEGDQVTVHVPLHNVHVFAAGAPGQETARLGSAGPLDHARSGGTP